ncbi:transposase [Streptomyces chartreusis]
MFRPVRPEHRHPPQAGTCGCRLLLRDQPRSREGAPTGLRNRPLHGYRPTRPRRAGPTRTPRTHPQGRHTQRTHGPQAADQARKAAYARRKAIVEPVFGQIMTCQNGRQLHLRGEDRARGEWRLLAACHNLRKIFRHAGTAGLATATG